jgi:DNA-binding transcriptional ArsR family regulator
LDEHPRSVTQLSKDMGVQQPVVSTHLSMLERLDLVNEPGKQQKNLPRRILSTGAAHELLAFCRAQLKVESELEDKIVSDEENDQ